MTKVVIAHGWTDPLTGKSYEPRETAEVTPAQARDLLKRGEARPAPAEAETTAEADPPTETAKPAPVKKSTSTKKEESE